MEETKVALSQTSQTHENNSATSLAELKELADKLAAIGDELTQTHSKNLNSKSWDLKKSLLSKFLVEIAMEIL